VHHPELIGVASWPDGILFSCQTATPTAQAVRAVASAVTEVHSLVAPSGGARLLQSSRLPPISYNRRTSDIPSEGSPFRGSGWCIRLGGEQLCYLVDRSCVPVHPGQARDRGAHLCELPEVPRGCSRQPRPSACPSLRPAFRRCRVRPPQRSSGSPRARPFHTFPAPATSTSRCGQRATNAQRDHKAREAWCSAQSRGPHGRPCSSPLGSPSAVDLRPPSALPGGSPGQIASLLLMRPPMRPGAQAARLFRQGQARCATRRKGGVRVSDPEPGSGPAAPRSANHGHLVDRHQSPLMPPWPLRSARKSKACRGSRHRRLAINRRAPPAEKFPVVNAPGRR
jgi:hypothetical protein